MGLSDLSIFELLPRLNPLLASLGFLLLGVVGSPHCLAMCGPICFASGTSRPQIARYQFGRLVAYLGLGLLAGTIGQKALSQDSHILSWMAVATLALGTVFGLRRFGPKILRQAAPQLNAFSIGLRSFAFGLSSALLPCGWLHLILGAAVLLANPFQGAMALLFFWLGSSPLLIWGSQRTHQLMRKQRSRWAMGIAVLIVTYGTIAGLSRGRWTAEAAKSEDLICHGSSMVRPGTK